MKKYFSGELPTHPVLMAKRNKLIELLPKKKVEEVVAPVVAKRRKRSPNNILGLPLEIFKMLYREGSKAIEEEEKAAKKPSEFA